MAYGATPTGFIPATFDEIRTALFDNLALVTDSTGNTPFLNASDDSVMGQIMSIFAEGLAKCWNAAYLAATQFDPSQAVGQYLTGLVQLNGLLRKPGVKTQITVDIDGIAGASVPMGTLLTDATTEHVFATDADSILPATVTATALVYSSWTPATGQINLIQSPIPAVRTVNNTGILIAGEDAETDAALRFRQAVSTAFPARSTIESLYSGIMQISGVKYARAYQNLTMQNPDLRGIPAKEVWEEKPDGYFTLEEWLELHPPELPEPYVPTPEELARSFNFLITNYLNQFAQTKQYDTIQNAMLMNSPDSAWEQDGKDAYAAYDLVWTEAIKCICSITGGEN